MGLVRGATLERMRRRESHPVRARLAAVLSVGVCAWSCSETGGTGDLDAAGSGGSAAGSGAAASGGAGSGGAASASGGGQLGGAGPDASGGAAVGAGGTLGSGGAGAGSGGVATGTLTEEAATPLPLVRQEHGAASL